MDMFAPPNRLGLRGRGLISGSAPVQAPGVIALHCELVPEAGPVPACRICRFRGLAETSDFRNVCEIAIRQAEGIGDNPDCASSPSLESCTIGLVSNQFRNAGSLVATSAAAA